MDHDEVIPILDFGSQYAQLIARRVREKGVYSELVRPDIPAEDLKKLNPKGIILSGGPSSVYEPNAPKCDPKIFDLGPADPRHLLRHAAWRLRPGRRGQARQGRASTAARS
jgi:GMP synthase-like glutamine amidotransferase